MNNNTPLGAPTPKPVNIKHGHTDEHVLMLYSHPVTESYYTIEQAEALIEAVRNSIDRLKEHKAKTPAWKA